ncbi:glucose-1-phosphate thymidylyltransferase [Deltaproteobacteria bacterium Smac51]|nr:glucose-1-phosphate thymidylyltransferase [Deltaproteobacteria bacterium Smac51]
MWYSPANFFDYEDGSLMSEFFNDLTYVWEALDHLEPFIRRKIKPNVAAIRADGDLTSVAYGLKGDKVYRKVTYELGDPYKGGLKVYHEGQLIEGAALILPGVMLTDDSIEIGDGAVVETGAMIKGPTIIGACSEVRQCAYVRGVVMSMPGAVIGHTTEAKNALLMTGAKAGHFAYLGDSILGREVNLGAGTKLANLKMNDTPYSLKHEGQRFMVERRKFGAIIGDYTETGCNTVTNPGTLLGKYIRALPNSSLAPGYRPGKTFLSK